MSVQNGRFELIFPVAHEGGSIQMRPFAIVAKVGLTDAADACIPTRRFADFTASSLPPILDSP